MIELKLNLPDWFLAAVATYFAVKVCFGILSIWVKRSQFKAVKRKAQASKRF